MALKETGIQIWRVRGIDGTCYASKLDAESAAREEFPTEKADLRYSRVYYVLLEGRPQTLREFVHRLDYETDKYNSQGEVK